jgi:hypothetical protein
MSPLKTAKHRAGASGSAVKAVEGFGRVAGFLVVCNGELQAERLTQLYEHDG